MNLRTMAFAATALVAFGTSAVSFAQTAPAPQGTPPPPPVPNSGPTSGPLISPSTAPTALPSSQEPPSSASAAPTAPAESGASSAASPAQSASPEGRRRGRRGPADANPSPAPSPTDTPEPPQFASLDGVWEVAFQPLNGARAIYSHLYVTQNGNDLTGTWRRDGKAPAMPFKGTFDGRLLKLTVTNGATSYLFSGYEENYMDMVGLFTDGDPKHPGTPFTAAHRKRERDRDVKVK